MSGPPIRGQLDELAGHRVDASLDNAMPKLQARLMTSGSIVLVVGLSLWLMEEAYLLAPRVFPNHVLGGNGSLQAVYSAVAISGFPLGGVAIRPSDKSAVRALLRTWMGLCLMLGTIFTATSVIIFTCDGGGLGPRTGANPLRYRILIHMTNAAIAFYFAYRFSRGLRLPHAQALQWAWNAGHTAGALIALAWPLACLECLPLSLVDPIGASWDLLLFVLPSAT